MPQHKFESSAGEMVHLKKEADGQETSALTLEAYSNFFKLIKVMREATFGKYFKHIFVQVWSLVIKAQ